MKHENVEELIQYLDREENFFQGIKEINEYNINAIIDLIQYYNIKEYGKPIYKRNKIKEVLKNYFSLD